MKVAIVGAGIMGQGISQVFASAGHSVQLISSSLASAEKGWHTLKSRLERQSKTGRIDPAAAESILSLISCSSLEGLEHADLLIESIPEDMHMKKDLFKQLDRQLPASCIFTSTTSSLSVLEMAEELSRPIVGMHFFNPAPVMDLVEVSSSQGDLSQQVAQIARSLGKKPIMVLESPGYVVNRLLIPMINEAISIYADGVSSAEDIDQAAKLGANHPIGPLALADLIGLDVCLAILNVFYEQFRQEKYRPHPLLIQMVEEGRLGKKTSQGFYTY